MNTASLPDPARMADKLKLTEERPRAVWATYEFDLPLSVYPATDFPSSNTGPIRPQFRAALS
jgi:hypothetical protein